MKTCQRCGYEWEPRQLKPKSCPACKSYKWNLAREKSVREQMKQIDQNAVSQDDGELKYELEV